MIRRNESNIFCAVPLKKATQNRNDTGFYILLKLLHPLKYRRLGDDKCETVDFTPYFNVAFQPFVRHLNLVAESKQWVEHNDTLTPLKFPFNIFGTIPSGPWTILLNIENPSPVESIKGLPFYVYVRSGLLPARQD